MAHNVNRETQHSYIKSVEEMNELKKQDLCHEDNALNMYF